MSETYIKAEIIRPKPTAVDNATEVFKGLFGLAYRVLFVWWAVAAWFPGFGLTYWQAVLPVYAIRMLTGNMSPIGRQLTK